MTNEKIQNSQLEQPDFVKKIGNTTFEIYVHFSDGSKENFTDKVLRLIKNEDTCKISP